MRLLSAALVALLMACAVSLPVPRQEQLVALVDPQGPVPSMETIAVRGLPPQVKQVVVKQLEADMERAAQMGAAAQAVRLEQKFENEILTRAVKKLAAHRGDRVKQAEDLRELQDLVRRDKRAVEALSSVLSGSSGGDSGSGDGEEDGGGGSNVLELVSGVLGSLSGGGSSGGGDQSGGGGGGSNVVSLIGSLVGSSSGAGDGDGEGGGSNILSILGPLSGSLSGGISGGGGDSQDGGGGSNILSLVSGLLGSSSGSSTGGGDSSQNGGGGSDVLSLLSGVLGSSSDSGGDTGGGASTGGSKNPLQGGTYDDLIGKGPFSSFGNGLSRLLMFKFTIFRTVFSLLTSFLTSSSSTTS